MAKLSERFCRPVVNPFSPDEMKNFQLQREYVDTLSTLRF